MKAPSRNISQSLKSQRIPARGPEEVSVTGMAQGGVSMTVPGEGKVEAQPAPMHERSAAVYVEPQKRMGGG